MTSISDRTVKILTLRTQLTTDPKRGGQRDTVAVYSIAGSHFFEVAIPGENPTAAEIQTAVRTHAQNKVQVIGTTFQV